MHHLLLYLYVEREKSSLSISVFYAFGSLRAFNRVKETLSRNKRIIHSHASCTSCIHMCGVKNLCYSFVFLLVWGHYEHLYRVKEPLSRNKRTLYSHASCKSVSICAESKILVSWRSVRLRFKRSVSRGPTVSLNSFFIEVHKKYVSTPKRRVAENLQCRFRRWRWVWVRNEQNTHTGELYITYFNI
jgi:hypothetical protein